MNNKKILNFIYIYILIQPFVDLVTALLTRFVEFPVTLGIVIRGIFIIIITIYILFFNNFKYKRASIIYMISLIIFTIMYIITKEDIFVDNYLFTEVLFLFKYMYISVTFLGLMNIFSSNDIEYEKIQNIFIKVLLIYSFLIILPIITGTSFPSYVVNDNAGYVGWFYSGNEVGAVFNILFPYLFFYILKKNTYKSGLILIPTTFVMIFIGTKTSLLGLILALLSIIAYSVLNYQKKYKKLIVISSILLLFVISWMVYMPAFKNIEKSIEVTNNDTTAVILSNRDDYLVDIAKIFEAADFDDQLFGVGFTNRSEINNIKIIKLIEMDIYDILFRFGYLGFILLLLPFIYTFYMLFKYLNNKMIMKIDRLIYWYSVFITMIVAFIAGHVLGAPSVAIYLAISMVLLISKPEYKDSKKILFISSTGGHLSELLQLKPMFKDYDYHLITEKTDSTKNLVKTYPERVNYLVYGSKSHLFIYLFKFSYNIIKSIFLYIRIKPNYIITTGTHTAVPMCYIGKLFGSKIIFIETFANQDTKTLSGKIVYPIADLFIVQWEEMLKLYPKATFGGWIY